MYLSRIQLDAQNRNTMRALSSLSKFHGALESSFSGEKAHILWRIDYLQNVPYLLLLSERKPDLSSVCRQFSKDSSSWETKEYDKLLQCVTEGSQWRFRLTANPTKSNSFPRTGKRGKVVAHITTQYQKKWLIDHAKQHGFLLSEDSFDVVQSRWYKFYKKENCLVTLLSVTYEGVLTITAPDLFRETLTKGIGREKAYGMGLLTIIRR